MGACSCNGPLAVVGHSEISLKISLLPQLSSRQCIDRFCGSSDKKVMVCPSCRNWSPSGATQIAAAPQRLHSDGAELASLDCWHTDGVNAAKIFQIWTTCHVQPVSPQRPVRAADPGWRPSRHRCQLHVTASWINCNAHYNDPTVFHFFKGA